MEKVLVWLSAWDAAIRYRSLTMLAMVVAAVAMLMPSSLRAENEYLPPEEAFRFSARMIDAATAEISYEIAPGYYMYREQFKFSASGASLGEPSIPQGKVK